MSVTYQPKGQGHLAKKVVALADGTRTYRQIAEALDVSQEYVRATAKRRNVMHLIVLAKGDSLKTLLRETEKERDALALRLGEAFRSGWRFAYGQWEKTGSVPDPDHAPGPVWK